jgi:hypothetical protein
MIANDPDNIRTSAFRTQVSNFTAVRKAPFCSHLWYGRVTFTFMVRASYVYIYGIGELRLQLWYGRVTFTFTVRASYVYIYGMGELRLHLR